MILTHGTDPNQVALTFDDGPNGLDTLAILRILRKHGAKATFFMLGKWAEQDGETAWAVRREGHEIGNHTYSHFALNQLSAEDADKEIRRGRMVLEIVNSVTPKWFRPPYGALPAAIPDNTVLWSQLSGDWAAKSAEEIMAKVDLDTDKGEIVLLHDGAPEKLGADRSATVKAVQMILEKWPKKQYVTLSELTI